MTALPSPEVIREAALLVGVCAHPVIARVTDVEAGEVRMVPISCGSTREDRCPPCADRAKRLRIQQCREGWHLDTEPEHQPAEPDEDQADDDGEDPGEDSDRRVRSTRRRQDAPDLPRIPIEDRTIGRVYTAHHHAVRWHVSLTDLLTCSAVDDGDAGVEDGCLSQDASSTDAGTLRDHAAAADHAVPR
jgi:hypothetical protein